MLELKLKSIIKESWSNVWRHKLLWLFGVFAGAGGFFYDFSNNDWLKGPKPDWSVVLWNIKHALARWETLLVLAIVILLFVVSILVSLLCRAALIRGISQIKNSETPEFKGLVKFGWQKVWRLLLIGVLLNIVNAGLIVGLIIYYLQIGTIKLDAPAIVILSLLVAYNLFIFLFRYYIYCFAVLEEQKAWLAIKSGWKIFSENIGALLLVKIVEIGLRLATIAVVILALLICALPFVLLAILLGVAFGEAAIAVIGVFAVIVFFALVLVMQGLFNAFFYHYLSLVYWAVKQ
jgi:hypothetical protein